MPSITSKLLADVPMTPINAKPEIGAGLYATHEGVFEFCGLQLRVYLLNDGRRVINADDLNAAFDAMSA